MNPIDVTQLPLRDIHLPGAVSWWPPAPGWWLLAALAAGAAAFLVLYHHRHRRQRAALRALDRVQTALDGGAEPVGCLQQVSMLLRRFAMTMRSARAEQGEIAGLVGERWLAYLDSAWERDAFRRGAGRLLLAGPYVRPDSVTREQAVRVAELCAEWIRRQAPRPLWRVGARRDAVERH